MKYSVGVPYEIVVVDDGSSEQTHELLARVPNLVYMKNGEGFGFTRSCNRGAQNARGEYVLFLSSNVQVTENWLQTPHRDFQKLR